MLRLVEKWSASDCYNRTIMWKSHELHWKPPGLHQYQYLAQMATITCFKFFFLISDCRDRRNGHDEEARDVVTSDKCGPF